MYSNSNMSTKDHESFQQLLQKYISATKRFDK